MNALPALIGHAPREVTPEALAVIKRIEGQITAYYTGEAGEPDWLDIIDDALSLAGLMITVSSSDNTACIQGAHELPMLDHDS